ncbi:isochorismatase family protein, partial [Nocardiopsis tropica]
MAQSRALVVVDVQQEYFTGLLPIQYPPRDESVLKVANAIDAAAGAGIPVVVVQHSAGDRSP